MKAENTNQTKPTYVTDAMFMKQTSYLVDGFPYYNKDVNLNLNNFKHLAVHKVLSKIGNNLSTWDIRHYQICKPNC